MSGLRKYDIIGPDAEALLQRVMTRDVARLAVWRGTYSLICDEAGTVIDDGTLFRLSDHLFRWCCGTEESARVMEALAAQEGLQVRIHGMGQALPNLALQGPRSRDVLRKIVGDAYEAGLGFALSMGKTDFIGKAALERNGRDPRRVLRGLWFEGDDVPATGAHVYDGERPVGVITSATRSPMFERTIAMARLAVEHSELGKELEVGQLDGHMKRLPAKVCSTPFYDPKRERARA